MTINTELSKKLRALSTLFVILVIFIHGYKAEFINATENEMLSKLMEIISVNVFAWSYVPAFFCISGLLLFKDLSKEYTYGCFKRKVKSRFFSLLIPYLIVSALSVLGLYISNALNWSVYLGSFNGQGFHSWQQTLKLLFTGGATTNLWFIRNLFFLALASPIIYFIIKKCKGVYMVSIILLWLLFSAVLPNFLLSLVFYSIGAYIAINDIPLKPCKNIRIPIAIFVAGSLMAIYLSEIKDALPLYLSDLPRNICIFLFIAFIWVAYDFVSNRITNKIAYSKLAEESFTIILLHDLFIYLIILLMGYYQVNNSALVFSLYLFSIFFGVVSPLFLAIVLKKYLPILYNVLSGSRKDLSNIIKKMEVRETPR